MVVVVVLVAVVVVVVVVEAVIIRMITIENKTRDETDKFVVTKSLQQFLTFNITY